MINYGIWIKLKKNLNKVNSMNLKMPFKKGVLEEISRAVNEENQDRI